MFSELNQKKKTLQEQRNEAVSVAYAYMLGYITLVTLRKKLRNNSFLNYAISLGKRGEAKFDMDKEFAKTTKRINQEINRQEDKRKQEILEKSSGGAYYLASSHRDSASDHKDYQGKLYVDENYKPQSAEEKAFASKLKTLQWVTGKPVWFVTRPHCRHFFKQLTWEQVKGRSLETLIRNHKMNRNIGNRVLGTVREQTGEATLRAYRERYKFHEYLYKVSRSENIKRAMQKDKFLIEKWRKYLERS